MKMVRKKGLKNDISEILNVDEGLIDHFRTCLHGFSWRVEGPWT